MGNTVNAATWIALWIPTLSLYVAVLNAASVSAAIVVVPVTGLALRVAVQKELMAA